MQSHQNRIFLLSLLLGWTFILLPWVRVEVQTVYAFDPQQPLVREGRFDFTFWESLSANTCGNLLASGDDPTVPESVRTLQVVGAIAFVVQVILWIGYLTVNWGEVMRERWPFLFAVAVASLVTLSIAVLSVLSAERGFECIFMTSVVPRQVSLSWPALIVLVSGLGTGIGGYCWGRIGGRAQQA